MSQKTIKLKEVLDISRAEDFKKEVSKVVKKGLKKLILNASEVGKITTPCIQIILTAQKTCNEKDIKFFVSNPSDIYLKSFEDLGIEVNNII